MLSSQVRLTKDIHRYLIWISYDGSRFPEMARGGTGFGVMDLLHQTFSDYLFGIRYSSSTWSNDSLKFSPSSRTDAHVHALRNAVIGQIPTEKADLDDTPERKKQVLSSLNDRIRAVLPNSMEIIDLHQVSAGFCVRRHVSYRRYTYRVAVARNWEIWNSIRNDPSTVCFSEKNYAWRLPPGFQPEKALDAAKMFLGEQVMGSFYKHTNRDKRKEEGNSPSAIRNILHIGLENGAPYSLDNDIYEYYNVSVVAKSFVREQIRRTMSCLIFHAYDRLPLTTIAWLLHNPISSNFYDLRIPIAPPEGLFLTEVVYAPEMFVNPIPYHRHSWNYSTETKNDSTVQPCLVRSVH